MNIISENLGFINAIIIGLVAFVFAFIKMRKVPDFELRVFSIGVAAIAVTIFSVGLSLTMEILGVKTGLVCLIVDILFLLAMFIISREIKA